MDNISNKCTNLMKLEIYVIIGNIKLNLWSISFPRLLGNWKDICKCLGMMLLRDGKLLLGWGRRLRSWGGSWGS